METLLNKGQKAFVETAILSPENIKAQDIEQLESMVGTYPQMGMLRILLARAYKNDTVVFGQKLKNAACCVPERSILYQAVNEPESLSRAAQQQIIINACLSTAAPEAIADTAIAEHLLPAHLDTDVDLGVIEHEAAVPADVVQAAPDFVKQPREIDDEVYDEITGIEHIWFQNPPKPVVPEPVAVAEAPLDTDAEQEVADEVKEEEVAEETTAELVPVFTSAEIPAETIDEATVENTPEVAETISAAAGAEAGVAPVANVPVETVQENEPEVAETISAAAGEETGAVAVAEVPGETIQENEPEVAETISAVAGEEAGALVVAEVPIETIKENEPEVAETISASAREEAGATPVAEVPVETIQENEPEVAETNSAVAGEEAVADNPANSAVAGEEAVADNPAKLPEPIAAETRTSKSTPVEESGIRFLIDHDFGHSVSDAITGDDDEDAYPIETDDNEQDLSLRGILTNEFRRLPAETPTAKDMAQPDKHTEEPETVSRYHDDKMPYTFMWWLDKTRREHAHTYQPYAPVATKPTKKAAFPDKLQQQYYENIFSLTTINDVDKNHSKVPDDAIVHDKQEAIIERFIKVEPQIGPPNINLDNENKARKSAEDEDALVSETLARIYTDQMLYHKAISTYKKLLLKFPEKNSYFVAQIELLQRRLNK